MSKWVCIERKKKIANKLELDIKNVDPNVERLKKEIHSICNVFVLKNSKKIGHKQSAKLFSRKRPGQCP